MELYVDERGPENAPTIVFLHGGGGGSWMWQPQLEKLTDSHTLAPDLPEHGHSMGIKLVSMPASAALIADLIRTRAHGGKACVVGLSLGAQITVELLSQAPELVDHAIVSSALLKPLPGAGLYKPWLLRATFRYMVAPFKKSDAYARLNMKWSAGIPDRYFPQFREDFRAATEDSFTDVMVANMSYRLPAGLDRVTAPTLVVVGEKEYKVMKESARELAKAIPTARAYIVTHDKRLRMAEQHNWSMTEPDLFTRTVRAWITDQPMPAELKPLI